MKISRFTHTLALCCLSLGTIAACGGGEAPADAPEGETSEAVEASESGSKKFDDMSPAEKLKHMKEVVNPAMTKVFQAANAEKYAEFGCATCHGPGAKDGNFAMPTADLPKLPQDPSAVKEANPEVYAFMAEKVTPEVASLLGEEPYNPETQQGFGCFGCHQSE